MTHLLLPVFGNAGLVVLLLADVAVNARSAAATAAERSSSAVVDVLRDSSVVTVLAATTMRPRLGRETCGQCHKWHVLSNITHHMFIQNHDMMLKLQSCTHAHLAISKLGGSKATKQQGWPGKCTAA